VHTRPLTSAAPACYPTADLTGFKYLARSCVSLEDIADDTLTRHFALGARLDASSPAVRQA
jgi:hypothetical protein